MNDYLKKQHTLENHHMTIQTLSDYQIGWLEAIFQYAYATENIRVSVEKIGVDESGEMIVSFRKFGQLTTERIKRNPD